MRLRLLNLAYLFAAIAAVVWVLFDLYSLLTPGGKNYPATSETVFSSVLNLPILAGVLVFLYALYKFPESAPKHARSKSRDEVAVEREEKPLQPIQDKDTAKEKSIDRPASTGSASAPEDDEDGDDSNLDEESTVLYSDSTTLEVDDYFEEEFAASVESDQISIELPDSVMSDLESEPLDPLVEAETFAKFGQYDNAVNVLLDAFDRKGSNHDLLATAIFGYIDQELNEPKTSSQRVVYLENRKTEIITSFTAERAKLSDKTWKKILPAKRAQNNKPKDDDADEVLLVNWH